MESIVIGITLANKTTTGVTASDIYLDGYDGTDTYIVKDATIPAMSRRLRLCLVIKLCYKITVQQVM